MNFTTIDSYSEQKVARLEEVLKDMKNAEVFKILGYMYVKVEADKKLVKERMEDIARYVSSGIIPPIQTDLLKEEKPVSSYILAPIFSLAHYFFAPKCNYSRKMKWKDSRKWKCKE